MIPYVKTRGGGKPSGEDQMDYEHFFKSELDLLRNEGRTADGALHHDL